MQDFGYKRWDFEFQKGDFGVEMEDFCCKSGILGFKGRIVGFKGGLWGGPDLDVLSPTEVGLAARAPEHQDGSDHKRWRDGLDIVSDRQLDLLLAGDSDRDRVASTGSWWHPWGQGTETAGTHRDSDNWHHGDRVTPMGSGERETVVPMGTAQGQGTAGTTGTENNMGQVAPSGPGRPTGTRWH